MTLTLVLKNGLFYAAFNSISVISRQQLTIFMLSWVSPVLGWALKCLAQEHSQRIQCGSNPGPLDYESNTTTEPRGTRQTNGRTDKQRGQKLYAPDLSMHGHKNFL